MHTHNHYVWLDVLKGLAIMAVLVDHHALPFAKYSIYSVSTFFIILGFNSYNSMARRNDSTLLGRLRSCQSFILFYIICSVIYLADAGTLTLANLYKSIVFFSASPPLYFCAIFLQLSLLSCCIYNLLKKIEQSSLSNTLRRWIVIYSALLIASWFISRILRKVIIFPDLHGGGKFLFGSTYLFLLIIGMIIAANYKRLSEHKTILVLSSAIILCLSPFYINFIWANPPRIMTCGYAVALFFLISSLPISWNGVISSILAYIGRYSIHIFMYHLLIMKYVSGLESKAVSFIFSIAIPILIGLILDAIVLKKRPKILLWYR